MTRYEELIEMLENHSGEGCLLWPHGQNRGYGRVRVGGEMYQAHRLSCEWAHGPAPDGKDCALHAPHEICGHKHCIAPAHLRWGTQQENVADRAVDGTQPFTGGESNGRAKITEAQVVEIRERYAAGGVTQKVLAAEYGVTQVLIGQIIRGVGWTHVGGPIKGVHYV